jgi:hypothetical protein
MRVLVPLLLILGMVGSSNESEAAETLTLKGHSDKVTSVSFSPDGKRLQGGFTGLVSSDPVRAGIAERIETSGIGHCEPLALLA